MLDQREKHQRGGAASVKKHQRRPFARLDDMNPLAWARLDVAAVRG